MNRYIITVWYTYQDDNEVWDNKYTCIIIAPKNTDPMTLVNKAKSNIEYRNITEFEIITEPDVFTII